MVLLSVWYDEELSLKTGVPPVVFPPVAGQWNTSREEEWRGVVDRQLELIELGSCQSEMMGSSYASAPLDPVIRPTLRLSQARMQLAV
ncbi:hypothetical protein DPEC_G00266840 [Dallia pectoralis]|uniref:Uncharacterized protein n=1 Tax=Dallia pectoralis TaxID=75939 RepID=A0ACC2FNP3_DALPE|nr:hypothetical protein DPEC_G00266840 [Dallia pectoralis]